MTVTPGGTDGAAVAQPTGAVTPVTGMPATPDGNPPVPSDLAGLRADIATTRAQLGETVQALAAKADVKARLQETADETKARVRQQLHVAAAKAEEAATHAPETAYAIALRTGQAIRRNPTPLLVAAGAVVLVVLLRRWLRRG